MTVGSSKFNTAFDWRSVVGCIARSEPLFAGSPAHRVVHFAILFVYLTVMD